MNIKERSYMLITCGSLRVNHRSIGSFFDMKLFQSVSKVWFESRSRIKISDLCHVCQTSLICLNSNTLALLELKSLA